jgi:hypothetical protein
LGGDEVRMEDFGSGWFSASSGEEFLAFRYSSSIFGLELQWRQWHDGLLRLGIERTKTKKK